jgi:hypothetical protein
MERKECLTKECRATFDASPADKGKVRHCNRAGPQGGHAQQWGGKRWQVVSGKTEHDHPLSVRYLTEVDGPGHHGEVIDIFTNDPASEEREPFQHDLWFQISVVSG